MDNLDTKSTLPYYLQREGYRTAVFGKYFNLWPIEKPPDYFDYWVTVHGIAYDESTWNVQGDLKLIPYHESKVIGKYAVEFLQRQEGSSKPWFVLIGTKAPHTPFTPQARYALSEFSPWKGNPAVEERARSDKPPFVRKSDVGFIEGRETRIKQFRTLQSTDDLVARVFKALRATGQEANTLAFFISDNGYLWGEHGLLGKDMPYTDSVRVPMLARWPERLPQGKTDARLVGNLDIAPTIFDATGVRPDPSFPVDGRSLLDSGWDRERIHLEHWCNQRCHYWKSTRTKTYQYIETYDESGYVVFLEYYDLVHDPWQLTNLLQDGDPTNDPDVAALHNRLEKDATCAGSSGTHRCP